MGSVLSRWSTRFAVAFALAAFAGGRISAASRDAGVNAPTPALAAFTRTWASTDDYRATVTDQERSNDGQKSSAATFDFRFKKPDLARIDIIAGRNRGGGAVYHGGDSFVGHTGGFLAGIKMTIALTDARAKSLRGSTIDKSSFGYDLDEMLDTPGTLSESLGTDGTTSVSLVPRIALPDGITRIVIDLSNANHLPVARRLYVGDTVVKLERFDDVKTNVGLADSDFT